MSIISSYVLPHMQILIPEIAQGREKKLSETLTSYAEVSKRIAADNPETIVIISSHTDCYEEYFHISSGETGAGNFKEYGAEDVSFNVNYDLQMSHTIADICKEHMLSAGCEGTEQPQLDHAAMVPLYYINKELKTDYKIIRVSISGLSLLSHYELGKYIKEASEKLGRRTVVIASGDLSHRLSERGHLGYLKEGAIYDSMLCAAFKKSDFLTLFGFEEEIILNVAECILKSAVVMAGTLDGKNAVADFLSYESTFGVGLATCCFRILDQDENNENRQFDKILKAKIHTALEEKDFPDDAFLKLARLAVETYVFDRHIITVDEAGDIITDALKAQQAGVFISLKINGKLRGCVGTYTASCDNLAEEIIANSIAACCNDLRFKPVEIEELDVLSYEVDVIGDFDHIQNLNQINVKKHGLFVSLGNKNGIIMPNVDGLKSPGQQLEICLKQAGLKTGEAYHMYRFKTGHHQSK